MGLETANPDALERLNKGLTLEQFSAAAKALRGRGVALRVFLLIAPPFIPAREQDRWLTESVDRAFSCGATVVSLIPTRAGNGAMEALADQGLYRAPDLADVERSHELALTRRNVGESLSISGICSDSRAVRIAWTIVVLRLRTMNLEQRGDPHVTCVQCGHGMRLMAVERLDADVAVVGSGFAGSLIALALTRRGRRVVLVERGRHPRFAIGESSTPLANLLLEELADRYDLPRIRTFSKWGTWQREHPDVACGLKRGFTFFFHQPGHTFADTDEHNRQLMVAASPFDEISDTHWYRPDFDHALVREAQAEGVVYLDDTSLDAFDETGPRVMLTGTRNGHPLHIVVGFVVDASGPCGFMHRVLNLEPATLRWLPHTHGLYSHFEDVDRWDRLLPSKGTPYHPDDAALHHVFPGGWIWMLRFNNGITSAGAALTDDVASTLDLTKPEAAWTNC